MQPIVDGEKSQSILSEAAMIFGAAKEETATKKHKKRKDQTKADRLCLLRLFVAYFSFPDRRLSAFILSVPYRGKRPRYSVDTRNDFTISASPKLPLKPFSFCNQNV